MGNYTALFRPSTFQCVSPTLFWRPHVTETELGDLSQLSLAKTRVRRSRTEGGMCRLNLTREGGRRMVLRRDTVEIGNSSLVVATEDNVA